MENPEFEKSKVYTLSEELDYVSGSVAVKTIFSRVTGHVSVIAIDSGEVLKRSVSAFDTLIQVIDGLPELCINDSSYFLKPGQCIILPAHASGIVKTRGRVKLISTIIKSGYEEVA